MEIRLKRAYDDPAKDDGPRVLVDRIWPRGITKEALQLHSWMKEVAPTPELRRWFGHDPGKWEEFKRRYFRELDAGPAAVKELLDMAENDRVTLVYGASDTEHNNAVALAEYLKNRS